LIVRRSAAWCAPKSRPCRSETCKIVYPSNSSGRPTSEIVCRSTCTELLSSAISANIRIMKLSRMNSGNVMLTPRSFESRLACWLWVNVLKRVMASLVYSTVDLPPLRMLLESFITVREVEGGCFPFFLAMAAAAFREERFSPSAAFSPAWVFSPDAGFAPVAALPPASGFAPAKAPSPDAALPLAAGFAPAEAPSPVAGLSTSVTLPAAAAFSAAAALSPAASGIGPA